MLRFPGTPDPTDPRVQSANRVLEDMHERQRAFDKQMRDPFNPLEYILDHAPDPKRSLRLGTRPVVPYVPVGRLIGALASAVMAPVAALGSAIVAKRKLATANVTAPGFGRAAGRLLTMGTAAVFAATAVTAATIAVATQSPRIKAAAELVVTNHTCAQSHVLRDKDGYAGAQPVGPCATDLAHTARFEDDAALAIALGYSVIEGGVFADDTFFGQDMMGIARWGASQIPFAKEASTALGFPFTRGGSSGYQSAVEAFNGTPNSLSVWQKPHMVVLGIRLATTEHADDLERAHFVSSLPVVVGYGGKPLGGLHGAHVLFDGAPEAPWQICTFGSALGKPFLLSTGAPLHDAQKSRNDRTRARARDCLFKTIEDPKERAVQLGLLEQWQLPHVADPRALDPAIRRTVRQEMRLAHQTEDPQVITLTASRQAQAHLMAAGDLQAGTGALAAIADKLPANACLVPGTCDQPVGMAFAAAEIVGDAFLPRAVRTNPSGALQGAVRSANGQYARQQPAMGQASIGKMAHIIVAAKNNVQSLCSKSWGSIRDFDGFAGIDDCTQAYGTPERRAVSDAIAWSANLGFIQLAHDYETDMRDLFEHLGWMGNYSTKATIGAALGLGMQPTPADVMQTLGAIEVGRLEPLSTIGAAHRPEGNGKVVDLAAFGLTEADRQRARHWMTQPVSNGTLTRTIARMSMPAQCTAQTGKTGTTFDDPNRLSKNLVMLVTCGARTFVLYGGVWTLDQAQGSVGSLTHRDLAPMLSATLAAALKS